jgi:hypothetical protein
MKCIANKNAQIFQKTLDAGAICNLHLQADTLQIVEPMYIANASISKI